MKQVGVIGYPVSHSLSPRMHQAALDVLGIEATYSLWETPPDALSQRIASLRSPDIWGANVTIPYKEGVLSLLDECDSLAARIGAVNTIVNRDSRLVGYNTDAPGFIQALTGFRECSFESYGKKAVILGTGGAARAAAVALLENGVEQLILLGRTASQIDKLINHLRALVITTRKSSQLQGASLDSPDANQFLGTADLVVNATPVGLREDDITPLIEINALRSNTFVIDMIFNPPMTPFLSAARAHGCHILNGLSMLLYQGALAFELWTGRTAPVDCMRKALGLVQGE